MNEATLLERVLELGGVYGVLAFHAFDSRKTTGSGFPDIVLSSPTATIFAELKIDDTARGYLKPQQKEWRDSLVSSGEQWVLWRPRHLEDGTIEQMIRSMSDD